MQGTKQVPRRQLAQELQIRGLGGRGQVARGDFENGVEKEKKWNEK